MNIRLNTIAIVMLLLASAPMPANAAPVQCTNDPTNAHYYEVIPAGDIAWSVADAAAGATFFEPIAGQGAIRGHLATVTSALENACINDLRLNEPLVAGKQIWLGGFQDFADPLFAEPGGGWKWVNSEGGISTTSIPLLSYQNWLGGEPNNASGGTEHQMTIGIGNSDLWNDSIPGVGAIAGYVLEFDGTVDAGNCNPCNPSGVAEVDTTEVDLPLGTTITQTITVPTPPTIPSAVCTGPLVYEDPRVDALGRVVVVRELDVFGELGGGVPGSFVLDDRTYGSPCFAIVEGSASADFTSGVVRTVLHPEDVSGIGQIFNCFDTTAGPDLQPDLQLVSEYVYSTTDPANMVEGGPAVVTGGCNSPSRAGTFRFSFHGINLHEDCGIAFTGLGGPEAILQCFEDRADDMFDSLGVVLKESKKHLVSPNYGSLNSVFRRAKNKFRQGKFDKSLNELNTLLSRCQGSVFDGGINPHGNCIMRTENLLYRVRNIRDAHNAL